jgi:hypothetical protein
VKVECLSLISVSAPNYALSFHIKITDITCDTRNLLNDHSKNRTLKISIYALELTSLLQNGRQFNFICDIQTVSGYLKSKCLINTEVSNQAFIDAAFVKQYKLEKIKLVKLINLKLANSNLVDQIKYAIKVKFKIGDHTDELWYYITKLGGFDLILGMPWLEKHDPSSRYGKRTITFESDYCLSKCLLHHRPVIIQANSRKIDLKKK